MKLIVDASVAVKWYFIEEGTVESRQLLAHRIDLHAPHFIRTEAANVIWKKNRRREIHDAQPYLEELARLPDVVGMHSSAALVAHASVIAVEIDHPVYDCLYIACAEAEGCPLVTADSRLQRSAESYSAVEVWNIADADTCRRISAAADALVIREETVRQAFATYTVFRATADAVVDSVPCTKSGFRMLVPEEQDLYLKSPPYLSLIKFIESLSFDERIDLKALAWYGRDASDRSSWSDCLNHAYRMGADDPHHEAGLGHYWQAGFERLQG